MDWYDSQGLAYKTIAFNCRSDYHAFTGAGIPAGGIFAGAEGIKTPHRCGCTGEPRGVAFDPCFHQACDTVANLNLKGLAEHRTPPSTRSPRSLRPSPR